MKRILIATILIILMSGMAAADQEMWPYGNRNVAMDGIENVTYDFEEGSNCEMPFKNQHPEIATFLDVPASSEHRSDTDRIIHPMSGLEALPAVRRGVTCGYILAIPGLTGSIS